MHYQIGLIRMTNGGHKHTHTHTQTNEFVVMMIHEVGSAIFVSIVIVMRMHLFTHMAHTTVLYCVADHA